MHGILQGRQNTGGHSSPNIGLRPEQIEHLSSEPLFVLHQLADGFVQAGGGYESNHAIPSSTMPSPGMMKPIYSPMAGAGYAASPLTCPAHEPVAHLLKNNINARNAFENSVGAQVHGFGPGKIFVTQRPIGQFAHAGLVQNPQTGNISGLLNTMHTSALTGGWIPGSIRSNPFHGVLLGGIGHLGQTSLEGGFRFDALGGRGVGSWMGKP